jgi:DNA polymerase-3 subunit epsilon
MSEIREIAFDTETTGLKPEEGDRIIELGAVEMINYIPSGRTFRTLINPGRGVSADTVRITGITDDDLKDAPPFEAPEVIDAFLEFIGDATLVAHNAGFDRSFLNMELKRCGRDPIPDERWVDTAAMARRKFPGAPASLDALCKRFEISLESRTFHGALLDSQLLAAVYLELMGGRARAFTFETVVETEIIEEVQPARPRPAPLGSRLTEEEKAAHEAFVSGLGDQAVWKRYAS